MYVYPCRLEQLKARRCGNVWYTRDFVELACKLAMRNKGHYRQVQDAVTEHYSQAGPSSVPFLAPSRRSTWAAIMSDILSHPEVKSTREQFMGGLERRNDFESASVDGNMKVVMSIKGLVMRHKYDSRNKKEFTDEHDMQTFLTLKSASSAFVGSLLCDSEEASCVATLFTND